MPVLLSTDERGEEGQGLASHLFGPPRLSRAEDEQEGVDPNAAAAAASLPAAEEAAGVSPPGVTSPVGSAAVAQRGVSPPRPAPAAGGFPPTGAMEQAVLAAPTAAATSTVRSVNVEEGAPRNLASRNITFDRNSLWSCAPWAFLLVFLLLGIVYWLMQHKFH